MGGCFDRVCIEQIGKDQQGFFDLYGDRSKVLPQLGV